MFSRRFWAAILSVGFFLSTSCLYSHAQSTYGSIAGTVTDISGATVTDANVTLTNLGTSEKRTQSSGSDGLFTFVNLFPGQYRIDVEKAGFKHYTRTPIIVEVQQSVHIDAPLQVGEVTQVVEVTSETPLLQTESASLGQVVEQRKADELPLNGRNIFNLITISPAAVAQGGSGGSPVGQDPFSWGKFSGGIVNLSTKSGSNKFHGSAYEYFRNKVLNANEYFHKQTEILNGKKNEAPPWVQNQYGFQLGGPVIKDKTFFYVSWEQYRQRTAAPFTTTVPAAGMLKGKFSSLCTAAGGTPGAHGLCKAPAGQIYDPYTVNQATGARQPYGLDPGHPTCPGNCIPSAEFSKATTTLWKTCFPAANAAGVVNNFNSAAASGGNTNEFVARGDQNFGSNTRLFGRFAYFGLTDLPTNPLGTGLCFDRCAALYHTNMVAVDLTHNLTPTIILDVNLSGSRVVYARQPILSGFDLTKLGWTAAYNTPPSSMRTPPTPAFPFPNDVGKSQGNSAIGDHNTQYNLTPALTLIRGKHTIQTGAQFEIVLANYFQTNIASGAFAFGGNWTTSRGGAGLVTNANFAFADFLLGLSQNEGSFVNQTEGVAQVPAQTQGKQVYRALYVDDTWHVTNKLTLSLGLRYELQGTWKEAFNRMTYWDPTATNATVTGCAGAKGSPCPGDAFLVETGRNHSGNNIPMDKKAFSPRIGLAYAFDQKTVIRAGYGIFYIPNYVSFGLNPDNDVVSLASTPFTATTNTFLTPLSTLNGTNCTLAGGGFGTFSCADNTGPFGAGGIILPTGLHFPCPAASTHPRFFPGVRP